MSWLKTSPGSPNVEAVPALLPQLERSEKDETMSAERQLLIMREFFEALVRDPWIEGRIKTHVREALRHWDDEHVAFQEAGLVDRVSG